MQRRTWAGAAGPRPPAATQSRWRTHGTTKRKGHVETVLLYTSIYAEMLPLAPYLSKLWSDATIEVSVFVMRGLWLRSFL